MRRFLLLSFGRFVAALFVAWLLLFVLLHLLPGAEDDPLGLQFPADRLAVTLPLVLFAGIVALGLGAAIGFAAARFPGWGERILGGLATLLSYLPPFWFGLVLALLLAGTLPAGGFVPWSAGPMQALASLLLPALALGVPHAGQFAIRVRGAFGPEPSEAELRPLRLAGTAPGPARWTIVQARALHQLPRLAATVLASLLVGAVVVENVFYLPGLGRQVLGAALAHDLPGLRASLFLLIAIGGLLLLVGTLGRLATDHQLRGTP